MLLSHLNPIFFSFPFKFEGDGDGEEPRLMMAEMEDKELPSATI
jgi:hypothetical protein